ncbi:MAG: BatD family protein [Flavobacteriales bacterium]
MRKTGNILLAWLLVLPAFIFAQEVKVEARLDRNPVLPGEQVNLTIAITNSQGNMNTPSIDGLQLLFGPAVGSQVKKLNGQRSSEYTYTWSYKALKEGVFEVPAQKVRTTAGVLETEPIKLKVSGTSGQGNTAISGNFAVTIEPSKRRVYLGEALVLQYKVYQLFGNFRPEDYEFPDMPGFWPEPVTDNQARWETQLVNGQRYQVATLKIDVLFPQKTGTFTLEGFNMSGIVGSIWNRQRVTASSKPITIEVLPLPENKPTNFLGTYQQLDVKAETNTTHLKANEAVNLSITFSGKGNLRLLQEPKIDWPADLEVYDPEVLDRIIVNTGGMNGSRKFDYLVIPRSAGNYTIDIPAMSWYSPKDGKYVTTPAERIELEVEKGSGAADLNYSFNSKSDVQVLNEDIHFIRPTPGLLVRPSGLFFGSGVFYFVYALPVLLFGAAILIRRRRDAEAADERGTRRKKAGRSVKKWLKEAEALTGNPDQFYVALGKGLEHYALDKFGLDRSQLNTSGLRKAVQEHSSPELAGRFIGLYEKCGMARYAPAAAEAPQNLLEAARSIINDLEAA